MKRLSIFLSICALCSLASCGGGDGSLDSCVSSYVGTFNGMDGDGNPTKGSVVATLTSVNEQGEESGQVLAIQFRFATQTAGATEVVMDDGTLGMTSSGLKLMGSFDFDSCEASGTWDYGFFGTGEWSLALPDSAF